MSLYILPIVFSSRSERAKSKKNIFLLCGNDGASQYSSAFPGQDKKPLESEGEEERLRDEKQWK